MTFSFSIIPWADLSHRQGRGEWDAQPTAATGSPRSLAAQGQARHSAFSPRVTVRKTDAGCSARRTAWTWSQEHSAKRSLPLLAWSTVSPSLGFSDDSWIRELRPASRNGYPRGPARWTSKDIPGPESQELLPPSRQQGKSGARLSLLRVAVDLQILLFSGIPSSLKMFFQLV